MQFVREFAKLGLTRSVGGVLALALSRELTPVVTCIILAGDLHQMLLAPIPLVSCISSSAQHAALVCASKLRQTASLLHFLLLVLQLLA